jgi:hypothetical protein
MEATMPAKTTNNDNLTDLARKAATAYLDGVEQAVEQIGDFQVAVAERYLGKPGGSLAESQAKAAKQMTAALVRVQREAIGA